MEIIYKIFDNDFVLSWLRFDYEHNEKSGQIGQNGLKILKRKNNKNIEMQTKTEFMLP